MTSISEYVGQGLKRHRTRLRLSQSKVAEKAGLSTQHYGRIERGDCNTTLETIQSIIVALQADANTVLTPASTHENTGIPTLAVIKVVNNSGGKIFAEIEVSEESILELANKGSVWQQVLEIIVKSRKMK
jgi:transcriptional regulator with XRE-family HTH domain